MIDPGPPLVWGFGMIGSVPRSRQAWRNAALLQALSAISAPARSPRRPPPSSTGDPMYLVLARRWNRILVTLFAVGVVTGTIRPSALIDLAADLPAPVFADLLGVHLATAVRWT